jgi:hypothetical protein
MVDAIAAAARPAHRAGVHALRDRRGRRARLGRRAGRARGGGLGCPVRRCRLAGRRRRRRGRRLRARAGRGSWTAPRSGPSPRRRVRIYTRNGRDHREAAAVVEEVRAAGGGGARRRRCGSATTGPPRSRHRRAVDRDAARADDRRAPPTASTADVPLESGSPGSGDRAAPACRDRHLRPGGGRRVPPRRCARAGRS